MRLLQKAVTYFTKDFTHLRARICAEYKGFCAALGFAIVPAPHPEITMLLASATYMYMITSPVYSPPKSPHQVGQTANNGNE